MRHHLKKILSLALADELKDLNAPLSLETSRNPSHGHFSLNIAFLLSKIYKQSPRTIAPLLCDKITAYSGNIFSKVSHLNGFINLEISSSHCAFLLKEIGEDILFRHENEIREKILLEFVSANPTGPLHIGHARGAIYGDTLARVGVFLGHEIYKEYYINDSGSQIDLLVLSVLSVINELGGGGYDANEENNPPNEVKEEVKEEAKNEDQEDAEGKSPALYKGEYIKEFALKAKEALGEHINDHEMLKEFLLSLAMQDIKNSLLDLGVSFNNFASERDIYKYLDDTLDLLKDNNATYELDGKLWLKSSLKGDAKDRVIIRDDGVPTYLAGDIAYHDNKIKRGFSHCIDIWGADHHGYIQRLKAAMEFLGHPRNSLEVLLSQMVQLLKGGQPYKMSKRAGNFILLTDVLNDLGAEELRFIFLLKRPDTHLSVDVDEFKQSDMNNPLFYINYANSRIHSIFKKSAKQPMITEDFMSLGGEWIDLALFSLSFGDCVRDAFAERSFQKIPEYLKQLSSKFHSIYNSSKIIDGGAEADKLAILDLNSRVLTKGLELMGIRAKTFM